MSANLEPGQPNRVMQSLEQEPGIQQILACIPDDNFIVCDFEHLP